MHIHIYMYKYSHMYYLLSGDECIRALSSGIAMSPGLNALDLGGNQLHPRGLRSLLTGLRSQQVIKIPIWCKYIDMSLYR